MDAEAVAELAAAAAASGVLATGLPDPLLAVPVLAELAIGVVALIQCLDWVGATLLAGLVQPAPGVVLGGAGVAAVGAGVLPIVYHQT